MYPHFQKMLGILAMLVLQITTLFAQNATNRATSTDSISTEKQPKTTVQHSLSVGSLGLQYDIRFRTPNKLTDFYASTALLGTQSSLQAGILVGNWQGLSLTGGINVLNSNGYGIAESGIPNSNVTIGLPVGIRCQPEGRGLFLQAQYMPSLNFNNGFSMRSNTPQIQIGYTFGKRQTRDTMPTPQGIQQSFAVELNPNFGTNAHYDARFRTKSTWLDWAVQGGIGTNMLNTHYGDTYLRNNWGTNAGIGVSALMGKKAFAFELGTRLNTHLGSGYYVGNNSRAATQVGNNNFYSSTNAEVFAGFRYQPPRGGVSIFLNGGVERDFLRPQTNYYYNKSDYFDRFNLHLGLGYSLPTRARK